MLGQILDALDRTGQAKNTLVIATGDNGAAKRPYPPLREAKSSIYEGGHREPFVARWPGKTKPNSVNHQTICLNDLFATCADMLGQTLPGDAAEDSVSFLSCLRGLDNRPVREATIHQAPGGLAIRQGPWKLVFHRSGERELFNLKEDVGEKKNLLPEQQQVVERLTALMQKYIDRGRSTPGPVQDNEFQITLFGDKSN
jgi:arylsulfatase A-like enzyme